MPKKIDPKVEGYIVGLSKGGIIQRSIVRTHRDQGIVVSQSSVHRLLNTVGKKRRVKAKGLHSPVKVQTAKVSSEKVFK